MKIFTAILSLCLLGAGCAPSVREVSAQPDQTVQQQVAVGMAVYGAPAPTTAVAIQPATGGASIWAPQNFPTDKWAGGTHRFFKSGISVNFLALAPKSPTVQVPNPLTADFLAQNFCSSPDNYNFMVPIWVSSEWVQYKSLIQDRPACKNGGCIIVWSSWYNGDGSNDNRMAVTAFGPASAAVTDAEATWIPAYSVQSVRDALNSSDFFFNILDWNSSFLTNVQMLEKFPNGRALDPKANVANVVMYGYRLADYYTPNLESLFQ